MTTDSDSSDLPSSAADAGSGSDRFGAELVRRVRPRTGPLRRQASHHFVGAVGRASVGFGRAVGRSSGVRPVVDARSLDTYALRPPPGWWHASAGAEEPLEPVTDVLADVSAAVRADVSTAPSARSPEVRRSATWTSRLLPDQSAPRVSARPTRPSRSTPDGRSAPSGREAAAVSADTQPVVEFQPSGDAKWDALRRAFAAGLTPQVLKDGPAAVAEVLGTPADTAHPRGPRGMRPNDETARTDGAVPAADTAPGGPDETGLATRDGRRGDTSAGRETGPGGLGRRVRPEAADPEQIARRKGAPAHTSVPRQPGVPSVSGPPATGRASRRVDPHAAVASDAPAEFDELRARLTGIRRAAGGPQWDTARGGAADERARGAERGRDLAPDRPRAAPARPASGSQARSASRARTAAPSPDTLPTVLPPRAEFRSGTELRSGPEPRATDGGSRPPIRSSEPIVRRSNAGAPITGGPLPRASGELRTAADAVGTTATDVATIDRPVDLPNLRLQRMIAAGHARSPLESFSGDTPTMASGRPDEVATMSPAVRTVVRTGEASPPTGHARRSRRRLPELPGGSNRNDALIRRMTIPRAMSSTHRPATALLTGHPGESAVAAERSRFAMAAPSTEPSADPRHDGVGVDASEPTRPVHVPRPLVIGQRRASTVARATDESARRAARPISVFGDDLEPLDITRVSVAPPSWIRARRELEGRDAPAAWTGDIARTVAQRTPSRPRTSRRREREHHLTTDWSLVKGSSGALHEAVRAAAPVAAPAPMSEGTDLAERFMTELSRSMRSRPAPLPAPFQPMAERITGGRKVMLSTDAATRKALRSVGKVAATTGDTIHLDPSATSPARMNHVMAHELTHIANPSPVARFFDDSIDSPEERRAEATAKIMARSPVAPTSSVLSAPGALSGRATASSPSIRRTPSASAPVASGGSPGTVSAEALAASITGTTTSGAGSASSGVIHRAWQSATPTAERAGSGSLAGSHRQTPTTTSPEAPSSPAFDPDSYEAKQWFLEQLEKNADAIVRLLSERIVTDLERRGGRMWGGI